MTRVVVAPDSFKGSIVATAAAEALAAGWRRVDADAELLLRPMADGGEGTLDAFAAAVPGSRRMPVRVPGPAGDPAPIEAAWLLLPPTPEAPSGTGVVELASACGIERYGGALRPWEASTEAFGVVIAAALDSGVSRLVLAIGSSASTDGGAGMLHALGARFSAADGPLVPAGAASLAAVEAVDLTALRPPPPGGAVVLADVDNPLLGPRGAAAVFGPQKGFAPAEVPDVDAALAGFAARFPAPSSVAAAPGAGAAGGTGFALAVWGARPRRGAEEVAALIGLREDIADASLVITGEGSYDVQTDAGKAPAHVVALAADAGVPVALVAGRVDPGADVSRFAAVQSLTDLAGAASESRRDPARWLAVAAERLAASARAILRPSRRPRNG